MLKHYDYKTIYHYAIVHGVEPHMQVRHYSFALLFKY